MYPCIDFVDTLLRRNKNFGRFVQGMTKKLKQKRLLALAEQQRGKAEKWHRLVQLALEQDEEAAATSLDAFLPEADVDESSSASVATRARAIALAAPASASAPASSQRPKKKGKSSKDIKKGGGEQESLTNKKSKLKQLKKIEAAMQLRNNVLLYRGLESIREQQKKIVEYVKWVMNSQDEALVAAGGNRAAARNYDFLMRFLEGVMAPAGRLAAIEAASGSGSGSAGSGQPFIGPLRLEDTERPSHAAMNWGRLAEGLRGKQEKSDAGTGTTTMTEEVAGREVVPAFERLPSTHANLQRRRPAVVLPVQPPSDEIVEEGASSERGNTYRVYEHTPSTYANLQPRRLDLLAAGPPEDNGEAGGPEEQPSRISVEDKTVVTDIAPFWRKPSTYANMAYLSSKKYQTETSLRRYRIDYQTAEALLRLPNMQQLPKLIRFNTNEDHRDFTEFVAGPGSSAGYEQGQLVYAYLPALEDAKRAVLEEGNAGGSGGDEPPADNPGEASNSPEEEEGTAKNGAEQKKKKRAAAGIDEKFLLVLICRRGFCACACAAVFRKLTPHHHGEHFLH